MSRTNLTRAMITVPTDTHEKLKQLQEIYKKIHNRHISMGEIIDRLLDDDDVIIEGMKKHLKTFKIIKNAHLNTGESI